MWWGMWRKILGGEGWAVVRGCLAAMSRHVLAASTLTACAANLAISRSGLFCLFISFSLFTFLCVAIACFRCWHAFAIVR